MRRRHGVRRRQGYDTAKDYDTTAYDHANLLSYAYDHASRGRYAYYHVQYQYQAILQPIIKGNYANTNLLSLRFNITNKKDVKEKRLTHTSNCGIIKRQECPNIVEQVTKRNRDIVEQVRQGKENRKCRY